MQPSDATKATVTSEMQAALVARADAQGRLSYADFIDVALFAPEVGYYQRPRARVGRGGGTDFYTATSLGGAFADLIVASAIDLWGGDPAELTFIEIGAEPGTGLLAERAHPFADYLPLRLGSPLIIPSSPCVVFANEWLDAQPFERLIFTEGQWWRRGVVVRPDEPLREVCLEPWTAPFPALPAVAPEGYELDLPLATIPALAGVLAQNWQGVFITCDYGHTWNTLLHERPQGTARTYRQHQQGSNLLASPGETDLTCHVCWDWLEDVMATHRFTSRLERQEAFLVQHGRVALENAFRQGDALLRGALRELLHPTYLGSKFQVLSGVRR